MHPIPFSTCRAPGGAAVFTMPVEIDLINRDQEHAALARALEPVSQAPPPGPSPTPA
jgi:hypothetical protein